MVGRGARVRRDVKVGTQFRLGNAGYVDRGAWAGDTVHVGRSYLGEGVQIGEMTTIGDHSRVGARAIVGAESRLGNFVRVAPDVWLVSPTYAEDGSFIMASNNMSARRPPQA